MFQLKQPEQLLARNPGLSRHWVTLYCPLAPPGVDEAPLVLAFHDTGGDKHQLTGLTE